MSIRFLVTTLLVAPLLGAVPVAAQSLEVPAAWSGIWTTDNVDKDCDTNEVLDTYTELDTLCTGEPIFSLGTGGECTGSVDDTNINVTCSYSEELFTGCTVTITSTLTITRNGDSGSGSSRFEIVYTGDCGPGFTDSCEVTEFTGTRTAPEPPNCGATPVAETTWGTIKSLYR